ncbi:T9SS type A sorting domain-containing protein [Robertkochia sediminum]|uniref:T9SS type A sorting domain-containing protein n=1 Tax=Robertkochia sediminum TaxID=2785326 RepID=UPI0019318C0F|nr:T9SS type A sorting domain-containing protein [Robertkochia sediminum]MBL7473639.1 T9SS type A sorting domain-containing protein [Robertkochia sediminum]
MKYHYPGLATVSPIPFSSILMFLRNGLFLTLIFLVHHAVLAQGKNDLGTRACVQDIGNGLYKANFTYENSGRREIRLKPEQSKVAFKKGRKSMQGMTNFKPGIHKKAFSVVFGKGETVTWTITNPSGKTITVEANSSASFCQDVEETDFIFPVYGENGKTAGILDPSSFALATGNGGEQPSEIIYQLQNERLLVEVVPNPGQLAAVIDLLRNTFGLNFSSGDFLIDPNILISEQFSSVDCYFPVSRLLELNDHAGLINFVRTNYLPLLEETDLQAVAFSEGDSLQGSLAARRSFGTVTEEEARFVDGSGFFTGVISDSYDKLPSTTGSNAFFDVGSGDLPGATNPNNYQEEVIVIEDHPGIGGTDEGRAMLQIVHDVAPGSKLAFHYAMTDQVFAYAVNRLSALGVDMIGDDMTFVDEEFDGDGPAGQAIQDFLNKGDTYFVSAAGNFLDKGFTGVFTAGSSLPDNNFQLDPEERAHVFGTNADGSEDYLLRFAVEPGVYLLAFQWDEDFASTDNQEGAVSDFDMYVVDDLGRLLVGNNSFSTGRDALEIMTFSVSEQGEANLMIVSEEGVQTPRVPFRVIAFRYQGLDFLEYGGAPTISGHASLKDVITVGAVNAFDLENVAPRGYSSFGGDLPSSSIVAPDIAAPDGVVTAVEGFERFFGTSAAAPHVMGAIALLKPAYDVWYQSAPDEVGASAPILALYQQFARPVGSPEQSGAGFIDVEATFASLAARAPVLDKPVIDPGINVSAEAFELTLTGQNFTSEARVFLNGSPLEISSISETAITVTVPEFSGSGLIYVEVQPKTPGGTEIVTSNTEDLLDDKTALTISVDSLKITYGNDYAFTYTVDGLPEDVSFEDLSFPAIGFSTPAVPPFPDVRSYLVTADFEETPDASLLQTYIVNFKSSVFKVNRRDLQIKPLPASYTYGDLVELEMEYIYEADSISQKELFLQNLKQAHESGYFPDNTFALVNRFRTVLNGEDILGLLNNNAWMVSENTIRNRFRTVLNGMDIIDLEMDHFEDYINADDPLNNRFRTVLNRFRTVLNGQDFFDGLADVSIENRFRTVLNETSFGGEDDDSEYARTFTIIDEADVSTDERGVERLYALNLITGLDVTPTSQDAHYTYPGVLLHPIASNFNVTYDLSRLQMSPATLTAITTDLILQQGEAIDSTQIAYTLTGYVYGETESDVFPDGVEFNITDAAGIPYTPGDTGAFTIAIAPPENYVIETAVPGILYVNPSQGSKIRTYFDCVQLNPDFATDGYRYIANFRYINPNEFSLYLLEDANYIEANGDVAADLPVEFLPGEHELKVRFDGAAMTWFVCTFGSCNPSSVSTDATLNSNRCSAKDVTDQEAAASLKDPELVAAASGQAVTTSPVITQITAYPNPVANELVVHPGEGAIRSLKMYDITGRMVYESFTENSGTSVQQRINTQGFYPGVYMLQIVTTLESKTIKVVKQ